MTPQEFIAKWKAVTLTERSACQQHFLDLCEVLGQPKPAEADPAGSYYTFERGVHKLGGGKGWADVWYRGHFGWEYKGKHADLVAAYAQLAQYREALENPPLLVVCDLNRFEIHTNFTDTKKEVHAFSLEQLADPANITILKKMFTRPEALKPGLTPESITRQAAEKFGLLADGLRVRGVSAEAAAHFLMKLMFCLFAEDVELLPERVFAQILDSAKKDPPRMARMMQKLFQAMTNGGDFGQHLILYFNGGLFADDEVIELRPNEIAVLIDVANFDWGRVEPSIFGTLFERTLDPAKRSQIGAHYTSREDILTLLEPVLMTPLRREWAAVKEKCEAIWPRIQTSSRKDTRRPPTKKEKNDRNEFNRELTNFAERLAHVTVLDPACGSGNFLYVAIRLLLDLNKEVITYASGRGVSLIPQVRATQLSGLEINPYAQQLAQVVIWIGYLQWMQENGFGPNLNPVLEPIESIRRMDAILDLSNPDHPNEPEWPAAEFIVGNPPFLGGKRLRTELGDEYVDAVFHVWDSRVPREADLCCYWFEKSRKAIERKASRRAGLLATQGIRGNANRIVLDQIKESGDIFFAVSDQNWILDGAAVHISMVGFDDGTETERVLDGRLAAAINPNLRSDANVTMALVLPANQGISFMGDTKGGAFDIAESVALEMLQSPNPNGRPNSDVVVPWINGLDLTRRPRNMWIIDFGTEMSFDDAVRYEHPFEYLNVNVRPIRATNKRRAYRERWWIHVESRPALRTALANLERYAVTLTVSKHRLFAWMKSPTLADHQLFAFARADDAFLGFVHSRIHEAWARTLGTQVRERESGFRYTPTSCFETFPFPEPNASQSATIATTAKELDELRVRWLNPPEWTREEILEFPGSVDGPWSRYVHDAKGRGIGSVRYPRQIPRDDECAAQLARRTLTNLYNQRPAWLDLAHRRLDEAVSAAYGWPADLPEGEILARLLELNLARS